MKDQIAKYTQKLAADRSAAPASIAFAAKDDVVVSGGNQALADLACQIISQLNVLALVVARPSLPFADFLLQRTEIGNNRMVPRDTETRTFLHDIPFLRAEEIGTAGAERMASLLAARKGIIVEGLGIIATGALTIEQAYINYSSVFHSVFVSYLEEVLRGGLRNETEREAFASFRQNWLYPLTADGLTFRTGPLTDPQLIVSEIQKVGRYTVERGLVDSFFGNISCRAGNTIYISQTAASLDELAGCIDPVPVDNSSTCGITASSELLAHRRIYETSGCQTILHGHPKFSVVMSMLCEHFDCSIVDCWRDCDKVRFLGTTPVVAGEIGAGGLAKRVPPVIGRVGAAAVYGHGVFTIGRTDFAEAFRLMVEVENWCRAEYFRLLAHGGHFA
jgi:ribulose-5-phosphate 4-epimerase/fuculose-1-phosphate aldolase